MSASLEHLDLSVECFNLLRIRFLTMLRVPVNFIGGNIIAKSANTGEVYLPNRLD
jgi:hypothetical protein